MAKARGKAGFFILIGLMVVLTACGGNKTNDPSGSPAPSPGAGQATADAGAAGGSDNGAGGDKELVVYGWSGNWDLWFKDWADKFKAETGITIKYISGPGPDMRQRIIAEDAAKSDIFISTPSDAFLLAQQDKLADIPWDQIPTASYIDDRFKFPQVSIWGYDAQLLAYNSKYVKDADAPKSWKEMADPKWKGKLGLYTPSDEGATRHIIVMMDKYGKDEAMQLAEQQYANASVVFDTPGRAESSIANGETYVNTVSMGDAMVIIQQAGGSIKTVVPEEGAFLMLNSMSMMKNAPHKDAALAFMKFYLSDEIQSDIMNNLGISVAVNSHVELTNKDLQLGLGGQPLEDVLKTAYTPDWSEWVQQDDSGNTKLADLISELESRIKK